MKKKSYPLYRCKNWQKRFQVTQPDALRTAFGETLSIAPSGCPVGWDLDFGKICLGRSKACRERAGRRCRFPLGGQMWGDGRLRAGAPPAGLPRGRSMMSAAWSGPAPGRRSLTPEVTQTRKQYPRVAAGLGWGEDRVKEKEGGRAGSAGQRGELTREEQRTTPPPPPHTGSRSGWGWGREAPRGRASRTHSPAPPPPRPPGGGSELPRAARAHKARARALPVASSSSRSARSVPAPLIQSRARALSQPPLPPRSCHSRPLLGKPSPGPTSCPSSFAPEGGSQESQALTSAPRPRSCLAQ